MVTIDLDGPRPMSRLLHFLEEQLDNYIDDSRCVQSW